MKKLTFKIFSLGLLFLSSVSQAVAQKIEVGGRVYTTCGGCDENNTSIWTIPALMPLFRYFEALNTISIYFFTLSSIVIVVILMSNIIQLLIKVQVFKTIQLGNLPRWFKVLFLCVYLLSVLIIIVNSFRYLVGAYGNIY